MGSLHYCLRQRALAAGVFFETRALTSLVVKDEPSFKEGSFFLWNLDEGTDKRRSSCHCRVPFQFSEPDAVAQVLLAAWGAGAFRGKSTLVE